MNHFWSKKTIMIKEGSSIVSSVDTGAEKIIIHSIKKNFPDHNIVSEEKYPHGIKSRAESSYTWYIDPLDGSRNYLAKIPFFCVSIALEHNGIIIAGVIYAPVTNELFVARSGKKSLCNGKEIHALKKTELGEAVIAYAWNEIDLKKSASLRARIDRLIPCVRRTRKLSCVALELCYVACGRLDGYLFSMPQPWDIAAGSIVAANSGVSVCDLKGRPWTWGTHSTELIAANPTLQHKILEVVS